MKCAFENEDIGVLKFEKKKGKGPSVGDPDPTTEVACTHRGRLKPRGWDQSCRLVALVPELIEDLTFEIPVDSGTRGRRPHLHGRRHPLWVHATSVVGSGL
ncbi:hypothetical protein CRG98_010387 [Punica granatum]|uniref:Uncharacterized protein n=1 Tax=Punica granatum TaxID=22663 RepID=A0A2I0KLP5_PUNGR|nr:hypothetical protein CRG98_010387 [Punica granatum]